MRARGNRAWLSLLVVAGGLVLASCVDESKVYEDRGIYSPDVEAALGFVGYADPSENDKLTVCGYCHGTVQAQWQETAHASARAGLQTSERAQESCTGCHTTNSLGNIVPEGPGGVPVGGYATAPTSSQAYYQDVQCESCHGPGYEHASDPSRQNRPLAQVVVGGPSLTEGCGQCHHGEHQPFVEEWAGSAHAHTSEWAATSTSDDCMSCHTGENALLRLGVTADYLGKDSLLSSASAYAQLTCAVCHDPHSNEIEGQLRYPIVSPNVDEHLCVQCHNRQAQPSDTATNFFDFRPHSPETGLLTGTAGYYPPGAMLTPGQITGPHAVSSNPGLCSSCHVVPYTTTDTLSGENFTASSHYFLGAPCVGPDGRPTGKTDCPLTTEARSFQACVSGECHASEADAQAALTDATDRTLPLVLALSNRLNEIDPNGPQPGGPIDMSNPTLTVAKGAYFNLLLALYPGSIGTGTSTTTIRGYLAPAVTHNAPLIEALLRASIDAVNATYGTGPAPATTTRPVTASDR